MRLKFEMWKDKKGNVFSRFTDGKGRSTTSYWSSPPDSIDHVSTCYLQSPHRHSNVKTDRHTDFIKSNFKNQIKEVKKEG